MDSGLDYGLGKLIESTPDLYTLKNEFFYLTGFKQFFYCG